VIIFFLNNVKFFTPQIKKIFTALIIFFILAHKYFYDFSSRRKAALERGAPRTLSGGLGATPPTSKRVVGQFR